MVIAMGFFAAFCGSILAAITAVGTIMMPKMIEQGYPKSFVIVLAASAALLEALIPPSNAAILFSALTNVPVSKTFAAGVIPGCVLLVMMVALVVVKCRSIRNPVAASFMERCVAGKNAVPALFTPVIILGGIYAGLLTPSESAAVAGIWAIVMGYFIYRELTFSSLLLCKCSTLFYVTRSCAKTRERIGAKPEPEPEMSLQWAAMPPRVAINERLQVSSLAFMHCTDQ